MNERWTKKTEDSIRIYEIDRTKQNAILSKQIGSAGSIRDVSIQLLTNCLSPESLVKKGFKKL